MKPASGDVAVVTGGASGLGKAIARRLAGDGYRVVITDIQAELGAKTAAELKVAYVQQDVCVEDQWRSVFAAIEKDHGRIAVLVNNAGLIGPTDAANPENARLADWRRIFAVNVDAVFLGCQAAIRAMRRTGGGSIVNISSVAGLLATPYNVAYGASKAAVRQLTKSVAQHCAEEGLRIRCNSVHPGDVRTQIWDDRNHERARDTGVPFEEIIGRARANIPLGDFPTPDDIAAAVSFLVSDAARFITGEQLLVDGGFVNCDTFGRAPGVRSQAAAPPR
jgi:NAD(P)-dependent dehydrogenase (short-subunit alcohol dehydrogenase family)